MAAPMRVMLLTDSNAFAGTERHMLDLAQGLQGEGVAVHLASPAVSPLAERAAQIGIRHIPIEKRGLVDWEAARNLCRLLKSGEIDLVHAHNGRTALSAALAVQMAGRGASVASQHFLEPGHLSHRGPKAFLFKAAHRWVDQKLDHYIAVSDAILKAMQAHSALKPGRVTVVPNGLRCPDPDQLSSPAEVRYALGITSDVPLIVCAARLEPEKDVTSLITAMALLKEKNSRAVCAVAGDGSLREALEQQIVQMGVRETVRLLGFRSDVLSLINAADLFVLPSLAEPFGLVLLEAMSLAKPVVATDSGGPTEIVRHEETGLLVPPGDSAALAESIIRLTDSPDLAGQMEGRAGRALRNALPQSGWHRTRRRSTRGADLPETQRPTGGF
jgi:glycosyltransferase involved in cell wall biosynthesis